MLKPFHDDNIRNHQKSNTDDDFHDKIYEIFEYVIAGLVVIAATVLYYSCNLYEGVMV